MTPDPIDLIGLRMLETLPPAWVYEVVALAKRSEPVRHMLEAYAELETDAERAEGVAMLQECLEEAQPRNVPVPEPVSERQLGAVIRQGRDYKARLRRLIDEHGGVSEVARRAEMPQPSLSRLLANVSDPRPSTLAKLARAMGVDLSALLPETARSAEEPDDDDFSEDRQFHLVRPPRWGAGRTVELYA